MDVPLDARPLAPTIILLLYALCEEGPRQALARGAMAPTGHRLRDSPLNTCPPQLGCITALRLLQTCGVTPSQLRNAR